ncbi:MAG: hypothetical protein M1831_006996 [Alyxoria varia]|nr:MAG: hypothetical protein M1831_006996 [Alyxoria varia]
MAALAELDASLQALRELKPPGVTKSRISSITTLCVENVKSEDVMVSKIFTHFKRTDASHKLGVLYVIDSVTRQWIEKAVSDGQDLTTPNTSDGTFAAGVKRVTELLPQLLNDLINNAPDDQKDKILKLVDIWERGNIFPAETLTEAKSKMSSRAPQNQDDTESTIKNDSAGGQHGTSSTSNEASKPNSVAELVSKTNGQGNAVPKTEPPLGTAPAISTTTQDHLSALGSILPAGAMSDPQILATYLQLLQQLVQLGVPQEQWGDVIKALQEQQQNGTGEAPTLPNQKTDAQSASRARSRSPQRTESAERVKGGLSTYRSRSPLASNSPSREPDKIPLNDKPKWTSYEPTIPRDHIKVLSRTLFVGGTTCDEAELRQIFGQFGEVQTCFPNPEKKHAFIKMFTRASAVHAKDNMQNTQDALILQRIRSTRWGVGFGPRDCCDYTSGVSVIPIGRLTEADRRWVLSAEYGGTGGQPIATGVVMEEPDIEIGAGVSSKAISRRVPLERNAPTPSYPPRYERRPPAFSNYGLPPAPLPGHPPAPAPPMNMGFRQPEQYDPNTMGVPPSVPGFGFQYPPAGPPR